MTPKEIAARKKLKSDFEYYASKCLKIRTKTGEVKPFVLNKAQRFIHEKLEEQKALNGKVRALILKGRQQGCSSYVGGRFYHQTTHNRGTQCFILTHALDATNNLFKMAQRFYTNTPKLVQPEVSSNNSKELIFGGLDSGYKIGTAETKSVGRSSTIQLFHGSELAFWSNASEHAKGILQAVPDVKGTEIILESTANGVGNYFHQMWQKAESNQSDFMAVFVPWFWQEEYTRTIPEGFQLSHVEHHLKEIYGLTDGQLAWRRYKIVDLSVNGQDGEKSFMQEYPCNANEAFQLTGENTFIDSAIVMRARKGVAERYGPLLIGVDPARFGDDRTSIIFRQGRVAFGLQSFTKKDTMEVTGIVHSLIEQHRPEKVFVDIGGLGAGVVDRLNELGHRDIVVAVNAGAKPLDEKRYSNKRAEMWDLCAKWLQDIPIQIPDTDTLHADLCGIRYSFDSNSRLVMEKKEDMKKRGVRSPDESDSLCFVAGTLIKTPNGEKPIEQLKVGDEVITPFGSTKIMKTWERKTNILCSVDFSNGSKLIGRPEHKIFNWKTGVCPLDALELTFNVESYNKWNNIKWLLLRPLLTKKKNSEFKHLVDIISRTIGMRKSAFFIAAFGQITSEIYQKVSLFTTRIIIGATMIFQISNLWRLESIPNITLINGYQSREAPKKENSHCTTQESRQMNGILQKKGERGMYNTLMMFGIILNTKQSIVLYAKKILNHLLKTLKCVQKNAGRKDAMPDRKQNQKSAFSAIRSFLQTNIGRWNVVQKSVQTESVQDTKVYNLTLEKHNAYYANSILVFNCLTFALPPSAYKKEEKETKEVIKGLAQSFNQKMLAMQKSRK